MRKKTLDGIRIFLCELASATRAGRPRGAREARLMRAYRRLPAGVQNLIAGSYRQCLMARDDGERARAREAVVADLVRGVGLTREQLLAPSVERRGCASVATETATEIPAMAMRRRPDSQPGSMRAVAVATALPDDPAPPRRGRRWLPYALVATAALACVVALVGRVWTPTPVEPAPPVPTAREMFPIERLIPLERGFLLFSHGLIDGDTTWLNVFEFNASDTPRPAVDAIVEVEDSDLDGRRDEDIDVGEPVRNVSESDRRIPARSVRRRVVPVKTRNDRSWLIKSTDGKRDGSSDSERESIHHLYPDR